MTRKEVALTYECFGGVSPHDLDSKQLVRFDMTRWTARADAPIIAAMMRLGWLTEPDADRHSVWKGSGAPTRGEAWDRLLAEIKRGEEEAGA